jgi:hypothetical protein
MKCRVAPSSQFADAKVALQVWLDAAKGATWNSLEDVCRTFPSTDMVGPLAIFDSRFGLVECRKRCAEWQAGDQQEPCPQVSGVLSVPVNLFI